MIIVPLEFLRIPHINDCIYKTLQLTAATRMCVCVCVSQMIIPGILQLVIKFIITTTKARRSLGETV